MSDEKKTYDELLKEPSFRQFISQKLADSMPQYLRCALLFERVVAPQEQLELRATYAQIVFARGNRKLQRPIELSEIEVFAGRELLINTPHAVRLFLRVHDSGRTRNQNPQHIVDAGGFSAMLFSNGGEIKLDSCAGADLAVVVTNPLDKAASFRCVVTGPCVLSEAALKELLS